MFEQGPQTISTDPGPSPLGCQSPSQADGSRTRKGGSQAALPFGSSLCAGPLGMAAWRGGGGTPGSTHRANAPRALLRPGTALCTLEHERGGMDGLPRSRRPLPQRALWKLRGQNNSRVTTSYYGKSTLSLELAGFVGSDKNNCYPDSSCIIGECICDRKID